MRDRLDCAGIKPVMQFSSHINITGGALRRWFFAQCFDSVAVGALWWLGLDYLHVPWAPFWAILAALLQFIPHFGPLKPVIMRRTARVPIWASLIVPILLSLMFGFWGLLLAAPLLAVIFAYRAHARRDDAMVPRQTPPGHTITGGQLISPGAATEHIPPSE